jgi:outer membrane protein assembly factor BamB
LRQIWRVELGKGYPGPIVAGERVFVVETVDDETVAVRALNRATGAELWRHAWAGSGSVPFFAAANGDWVRSTPAFDGETLYVGDMIEHLLALDGGTGEVRWQVRLPERYGTKPPEFGFASSPLVVGDALYVQAANSLLKLDKRTGEGLWRALANDGTISASGAFSSPVMAEIEGKVQLVVQTREELAGVDPETGDVLWRREVPNFRGMNILTPLVHENTIFTSPYRGVSYLYTVTRKGGEWSVEETWTNKGAAYMSSPVRIDGHVYVHLGNSRLDCIDLRTGESRWRSKGFGKYWSMTWQGDKILALDEDGSLHLVRATPERFELLDSRQVSRAESWGHLAVSADQVFVRELKAVAAYRWPAGPTAGSGAAP